MMFWRFGGNVWFTELINKLVIKVFVKQPWLHMVCWIHLTDIWNCQKSSNSNLGVLFRKIGFVKKRLKIAFKQIQKLKSHQQISQLLSGKNCQTWKNNELVLFYIIFNLINIKFQVLVYQHMALQTINKRNK